VCLLGCRNAMLAMAERPEQICLGPHNAKKIIRRDDDQQRFGGNFFAFGIAVAAIDIDLVAILFDPGRLIDVDGVGEQVAVEAVLSAS
jgi:hypothetical protein